MTHTDQTPPRETERRSSGAREAQRMFVRLKCEQMAAERMRQGMLAEGAARAVFVGDGDHG